MNYPRPESPQAALETVRFAQIEIASLLSTAPIDIDAVCIATERLIEDSPKTQPRIDRIKSLSRYTRDKYAGAIGLAGLSREMIHALPPSRSAEISELRAVAEPQVSGLAATRKQILLASALVVFRRTVRLQEAAELFEAASDATAEHQATAWYLASTTEVALQDILDSQP